MVKNVGKRSMTINNYPGSVLAVVSKSLKNL